MEKTAIFYVIITIKCVSTQHQFPLNDTAEDTALSSSYLLVRAKSNGKNVFCLFCFV